MHQINGYNRKYINKSLDEENWEYYLGDTFQFWVGPKPPVEHPKYASVMNHLGRIYQSYNIIQEGVTHYVNALVGKPFHWYLSQNGEPVDRASKVEELLQKWWDWQKYLAITTGLTSLTPLSQAIAQMLVRDIGVEEFAGIGVSYLRLYTPKRLAESKNPWERFVLHCPIPGAIIAKRDDDGFLYEAIYNYNRGQEVYTLLDSGKTRIATPDETLDVDLGGRLPVFEMRGRCLLSEDIKQAQNSINKTLTIKSENLNTAGFLERVLLNAQLPGEWVADPSSPGGEKFVPSQDPLEFGANKITFVQGLPIGDPRSPSGYTSPSIQYRQPVDVGTFRQALEIDTTFVYRAMGLGHLLSAGDGSLSGVSRETIKQDFKTRLEGYGQSIETVLQQVFKLVLLLISQETGQKDLTAFDPVVQLNLATGDPLPEEKKANLEDLNAGIISKTTAMTRAGIDDPDAELELINREREEAIKLAMKSQGMIGDQSPQMIEQSKP